MNTHRTKILCCLVVLVALAATPATQGTSNTKCNVYICATAVADAQWQDNRWPNPNTTTYFCAWNGLSTAPGLGGTATGEQLDGKAVPGCTGSCAIPAQGSCGDEGTRVIFDDCVNLIVEQATATAATLGFVAVIQSSDTAGCPEDELLEAVEETDLPCNTAATCQAYVCLLLFDSGCQLNPPCRTAAECKDYLCEDAGVDSGCDAPCSGVQCVAYACAAVLGPGGCNIDDEPCDEDSTSACIPSQPALFELLVALLLSQVPENECIPYPMTCIQ